MSPAPARLQPGLAGLRHWVFDMDGTLTVAAHDFNAIKAALQIAAHEDILQHLAALPAAQQQAKRAWLFEHEQALAAASVAAEGAVALLRALHAAGCRLGILTRNDHALALQTLQAIGLQELFSEADVIGRDEAPPKPLPDGLHYFLRRWQVAAGEVVMVGDSLLDLQCGRAAGAATVLVNVAGDPWPGLADWRFDDCHGLHSAWRAPRAAL